jgi:hypothetical protein
VRRRHRAADQWVTGTHVAVSGSELRQRFWAGPDPIDLRLRLWLLVYRLLNRLLNRLLLNLMMDRLVLDWRLLDRLLLGWRLLNRLLNRLLLRPEPLGLLPDPLGRRLMPGLRRWHRR